MRIEFIDQHYLDVFIKRQMHDALKALPSKISSSMTAPTSSQETKATAKVVVDFCNSLSRSAGSRGYFPESPLPDVSMMTASPDGASLAVSPMNSVFAASRGSQYRDSEEIVIESPLVKFSSPLAQAAERNGALMLGALTYSSPACGKTCNRERGYHVDIVSCGWLSL